MIYLLPAILSIALGVLTLKAILKDRLPGALLVFFLGSTLGLGLSGLLTFTSFILFNKLLAPFVIVCHLGGIGGLGVILKKSGHLDFTGLVRSIRRQDIMALCAIAALVIPMILFTRLYPYGGWDAWGFWNTKARFLFLGGTNWTGMFDPALWRVQTSYPFLLPLINVWFWSFGTSATYAVPAAMTCIIPFLTAGLLYSLLKEMTKKPWAILAPVWIFTNMFTIQLAASQYSDLLLGLFLLATVAMFILAQTKQDNAFLILTGLFLGMMAFTKVDGTALAVLTLIAASVFTLRNTPPSTVRRQALAFLLTAATVAAIPLLVFLLAYAPANKHIFTNGLFSPDHPTSIARLATVLVMFGQEFINLRWSGLWLVFGLMFIIARPEQSLRPALRLIPAILGSYLLVCLITYTINTAYPVAWWIDSSFNRIILALIPTVTLWAFLSHEK